MLTNNGSVSYFTRRARWNIIWEACFVFEKVAKKCNQKHVLLFVSIISTSTNEKKKKNLNKSDVFAAKSHFIEQATHFYTGFKKSTKVCNILHKSNWNGEPLHFTLCCQYWRCAQYKLRYFINSSMNFWVHPFSSPLLPGIKGLVNRFMVIGVSVYLEERLLQIVYIVS